MDQRRTDRGPPTRLEQEDDHQPSVQDIRHPLQLAPDVRPRKIRQEPQAGAAPEGLHRRSQSTHGHPLHGRRQQQQQLLQERTGTRTDPAQHQALEHGGTAASTAGFQSVRSQLLPGLRHGVSHSSEHDPSVAAE